MTVRIDSFQRTLAVLGSVLFTAMVILTVPQLPIA